MFAVCSVNFDDIQGSLRTLFEISTLEMWPDILTQVEDSTPAGLKPSFQTTAVARSFFVVFIFLANFWLLTLFIALVVEKFTEKFRTTPFHITLVQGRWLQLLQSQVLQTEFKAKSQNEIPTGLRGKIYRLVDHWGFDTAIAMLVFLNVIVMSTEHIGMSTTHEENIEIIMSTFGFLFTAEILLKFIGYGIIGTLKNMWNVFDLVLVVLFLSSFILKELNMHSGTLNPNFLRVFRFFRVARVFRIARLIPRHQGLKEKLRVLIRAIPAVLNLFILMCLIIFIYAVIGMNSFSHVKFGECLNEHANFKQFGRAASTLFRVTTGESWNCIMHDIWVQPPLCTPEVDCGAQRLSMFYFISFIVINVFLLTNVFLSVLLDNYSDPFLNMPPNRQLNKKHQKAFFRAWKRYKTQHNHGDEKFISYSELPKFLQSVPPPLGASVLTENQMLPFIKSLYLPRVHNPSDESSPLTNKEDGIHFFVLYMALLTRVFTAMYESFKPLDPDNPGYKRFRQRACKKYPEIAGQINMMAVQQQHVSSFVVGLAANVIQKWWRKVQKKRTTFADDGFFGPPSQSAEPSLVGNSEPRPGNLGEEAVENEPVKHNEKQVTLPPQQICFETLSNNCDSMQNEAGEEGQGDNGFKREADERPESKSEVLDVVLEKREFNSEVADSFKAANSVEQKKTGIVRFTYRGQMDVSPTAQERDRAALLLTSRPALSRLRVTQISHAGSQPGAGARAAARLETQLEVMRRHSQLAFQLENAPKDPPSMVLRTSKDAQAYNDYYSDCAQQ